MYLALFQFFSASLAIIYGPFAAIHERKQYGYWQRLQEYLSPWKTLGSHLNLPLFLISSVHLQCGSGFFDLCTFVTEVRGSKVFRCLWVLMPKVWISLKTLSAPSATRNKACAVLNGNPACEVRGSKVIHCQQMNPEVGVAEAMKERTRRERSCFSQVIQGEI